MRPRPKSAKGALKHTPASKTAVAFISLVAVVLIGFGFTLLWLGLREKLRDFIIVGVGMAFIGAIIVTFASVVLGVDCYFSSRTQWCNTKAHPSDDEDERAIPIKVNRRTPTADLFTVQADTERHNSSSASDAARISDTFRSPSEITSTTTIDSLDNRPANKVMLAPLSVDNATDM